MKWVYVYVFVFCVRIQNSYHVWGFKLYIDIVDGRNGFSFDARHKLQAKGFNRNFNHRQAKQGKLFRWISKLRWTKTISLRIFSDYISMARNLELHLQTCTLKITPTLLIKQLNRRFITDSPEILENSRLRSYKIQFLWSKRKLLKINK